MVFPFGNKQPEHTFNFHDDEALHDQTPGAKPWYSNLGGDTVAAVKLLKGATKKGFQQAAKDAVGGLDLNDPLSKTLSKEFVSLLWGSMLHPPHSYLGNEHKYRTADGSNNSILYPHLGQAGLPYAKTVQGKRSKHGALPDPGDLFDLLMARDESKQIESKTGISSLLLYHATLIIHDIFRTSSKDKNISDTSSYLDLTPLYGNSDEAQRAVRQMRLGLLKPDTFAEHRLLNQPPGVTAYLIMYNRFHNYVAKQLLQINENGRFSIPDWLPDEERDRAERKQDEDLFQTARLVTCGMYIQIAIHDYLRCLMGMHPTDTPWTLDPRAEFPEKNNKSGLSRGEGNMVSVEFNLLYRFHSPISKRDADWSEKLFKGWMRSLGPNFVNDKATKEEIRGGKFITNAMIDDGDIPVPFMRRVIDAGNNQADRNIKRMAQYEALKLDIRNLGPKFVNDNATKEQIESGTYVTNAMIDSGDLPVSFLSRVIKTAKEGAQKDLEDMAKAEKERREAEMTKPEKERKEKMPQWFPEKFGLKDRVFTRQEDGKFKDEELVAELTRSIEDPICEFGSNNIPKIFRSVEILGMIQGREWEIATLNEFREFFGMSRHKHFEDINTHPDIQNALRDLYEDPDMVELYPGLWCEGEERCLDPGVACPGGQSTALWRGVFSDAVTLVRSDRFYTTDWNVQSLTSWGMKEVTSDPKINKGSVFHRLFQRAFPGYFEYNSLHMWQPFYTPAMNLILAGQQNYLDKLSLKGLEYNMSSENKYDPKVYGESVKEHWQPVKDLKGLKSMSEEKRSEARALIKFPVSSRKEDQYQSPTFGGIDYQNLTNRLRRSNADIKLPLKRIVIDSYRDIQKILGEHDHKIWVNPGILVKDDIPGKALREVLTTGSNQWDKSMEALKHHISTDEFIDYFEEMSNEIRIREERKFQKYPVKGSPKETVQVYQLDIIKDYSIPIITRFFVDFLGVWDEVKTPAHLDRKYSENQIYQHLDNCQNYQSWDSDETKTWQRRVAYKESIKFLKELAERGVAQSEWFTSNPSTSISRAWEGLWHRSEETYVTKMRAIGLKVIRELRSQMSQETVAALMLAIALDVAHKIVLSFTEILAYFVDPEKHKNSTVGGASEGDKKTQLWKKLNELASKSTNKSAKDDNRILKKYVLEAQRLSYKLKLARMYEGSGDYELQNKEKVQKGQLVLLDLYTASRTVEEKKIGCDDFSLDRNESDYLIYGDEASFTKKLSLHAMTGMLKHAAKMKELRVAHDKLGRLKRVVTPDDFHCYANAQWDRLLPFPTTWNLRFNGLGLGVFECGDNANQGHGQDQLYRLALKSYDSQQAVKAKAVEARTMTQISLSSYAPAMLTSGYNESIKSTKATVVSEWEVTHDGEYV